MAFLGHISPHPSPSILSEDELSSAASDASEFAELFERSSSLLRGYKRGGGDGVIHRVLVAALEHLPIGGKTTLMREIVVLGENWENLRNLGQFFIDAVLKAMRYKGSPINPPMGNSPSPDAALEIPSLMALLDSSSRSRQSVLKTLCLRRDGYRCAISGAPDVRSQLLGRVVYEKGGLEPCATKCAHIIPFGIRNIDADDAREMERKATIWWALYRYFPGLQGRISSDTVNKPENAITLGAALHLYFDAFAIAFNPSREHKGVFETRYFTDLRFSSVPQNVVLRPQESGVPLPYPEFLHVHFVVASILHVSGIGRRLDAFLDPEFWEGVHGAAKADGSTDLAALLERRMVIGI